MLPRPLAGLWVGPQRGREDGKREGREGEEKGHPIF